MASAMIGEFGSYYLRRFYCTLKQANPNARVFLYQSWLALQADVSRPDASPPPYRYDWRAEMAKERVAWIALADAASRPGVRAPSRYRWLNKLDWTSKSDAGCKIDDPIHVVPVGDVLVHIADRLVRRRDSDHFLRKDGTPFQMADLFANPYVNWPVDWPLPNGTQAMDVKAVLARLKLRDPGKAFDPHHASLEGIYVAALVHFAVLYRQSPVGLPFPAILGEGLARTLQCIAWQTATNTPQAGIGGEGDCKAEP